MLNNKLPWPLKSNVTILYLSLIDFDKEQKDIPECPAPCKHSKIGPLSPFQ